MMLIDREEQRPWSIDELAREIGDRGDTTDAIAHLYGGGLLHRCGEFVWATRAAMHAEEVAL